MCAEALSQEEIDALLRGHSEGASEEEPSLAPEEQEVASEYAFLFRDASEDIWSKLSALEITVDLDKVDSVDTGKFPTRCPEDLVLVQTAHEKDIRGGLILIISEPMAIALAGAMTGSADEFGELEQSALSEGLGQVLGALCTQLSSKRKIQTQTKPMQVEVCRNSDPVMANRMKTLGPRAVAAFMQIKTGEQSGDLILLFSNPVIDGLMKAAVAPVQVEAPSAQPTAPQAGAGAVRPAVFEPFQEAASPGRPGNLDLILDIGLDVRVELGRTAMKIRDVLELGPGSVIELDKLAGEPVDLLVNDRLFARGEVVVIDESFGVRVTDIINIRERIEALGE